MAWNDFLSRNKSVPTVEVVDSTPKTRGELFGEVYELQGSNYREPKPHKYQGKVFFGQNNQFPIDLVDLRKNSSLHNAIIDGKSNLTAGDGLIFADTKEQSDAWLLDNFSLVPFWRKLNRVWWQTVRDQITFGYSCFQVSYNLEHNKIIDINWVDTSRIVCEEKDENGDLVAFWYSDDWKNPNCKPKRIPIFNPNNKDEDRQLMFIQWEDNNMDYYALPTYFGSIKDIKSDALISDFNLNSITNGFSPTTAITYIGKKETPEAKRKFQEKMQRAFIGIKNKIITFIVESKDDKPIIETFDAKNVDTALITLQQQVTEKIIIGHKVNPVICSIPIPGKLGYSNEVIQSYAITEAITFKPERSMMLDAFKEVLIFNGVTKVKVDVISPVKDLQQASGNVFNINPKN